MEIFDNLFYEYNFELCLGPINKEISSAKLHPNCHWIRAGAFEKCEQFKNLEICKNLKRIEHSAFSKSGIEMIDFSMTENAISLEQYVFDQCTKLKKSYYWKNV